MDQWKKIAGCLALGTACAVQAAPVLVTSPALLGANDTVSWAQLGGDGATVTQNFSATSANGWAINGALSGSDGCLAVVTTGVNCGWGATTGFASGDSVIWAENGSTFTGSGPISLSFAAVFGAGLYLQSTAAGSFTASISAFDGANLLATFTATSRDGSGLFIGVLDALADITRIQVGLTSCAAGCDTADFAINRLLLNEPQANDVPEPPATAMVGLALLALASTRRRAAARATHNATRSQEVSA